MSANVATPRADDYKGVCSVSCTTAVCYYFSVKDTWVARRRFSAENLRCNSRAESHPRILSPPPPTNSLFLTFQAFAIKRERNSYLTYIYRSSWVLCNCYVWTANVKIRLCMKQALTVIHAQHAFFFFFWLKKKRCFSSHLSTCVAMMSLKRKSPGQFLRPAPALLNITRGHSHMM